MLRLAVRMLVGDTVKWLGVVLGVFFCTFLITHMLSMFNGLLQRTYASISDIPEADLWVMDPATEYVDETAGLPATALDRVRSVEGVAWAVPLMNGSLRARLPGGQSRSVAIIGVDDATLIGAPERIEGGTAESLRTADRVIVDRAAANELLRVPVAVPPRHPGWNFPDFSVPTRPLRVGDELLINDHRVVVAGLADLGPRFISRAVVYATYTHGVQITPRQRNMLSYVLVKAGPEQSAAALAERIQERTGLRARTRENFQLATKDYFVRVSGVISRIAFMVGIGVVVGIAVSGLLLFLFTAESAKFYATFKALGASNRTIVGMVVVQAVVSGAMGYGLGSGVSAAMGAVIRSPAMPYQLTWQTLAFTAVTTLVVTVCSSILSGIKVMRLEPAMVFNT